MKQFRIAASSLFTLMLLLAVSPTALAHTTTGTDSDHAHTASETTSAKPTKTLAQRVEENKAKQTTKLTAQQEANLKTKCTLAQTKSTVLAKKVTDNDVVRGKAYKKISASLETLTAKLEAADYDATTLEDQQTMLAGLIKTYQTDTAAYKQFLADINEIECVTDPAGYKATLEAARLQRAVVNKDAVAIRTYINDTVKPALKVAQTELTKEPVSDQGGTQ